MPSYEFRCVGCGSFEESRSLAEAGSPASCPACASPARRVYTAPVFSVRGALRDAGAATRRLADRAASGEPTITASPSGRRLPPGRHVH